MITEGAGDLEGCRVVTTRRASPAASLIRQLQALGAVARNFPAIAIEPPHDRLALVDAVASIAQYDWVVFTSANAVPAFADALRARRTSPVMKAKIAAIGSGTADAVVGAGLQCTFVGSGTAGADFAREIPVEREQRILIPSSALASGDARDALRARGVVVDQIEAYRTVPGEGLGALVAALHAHDVDVVVLTSGSAARYLSEAVRESNAGSETLTGAQRPAIVGAGASAVQSLRADGIRVDETAERVHDADIIAAIMRAVRRRASARM